MCRNKKPVNQAFWSILSCFGALKVRLYPGLIYLVNIGLVLAVQPSRIHPNQFLLCTDVIAHEGIGAFVACVGTEVE